MNYPFLEVILIYRLGDRGEGRGFFLIHFAFTHCICAFAILRPSSSTSTKQYLHTWGGCAPCHARGGFPSFVTKILKFDLLRLFLLYLSTVPSLTARNSRYSFNIVLHCATSSRSSNHGRTQTFLFLFTFFVFFCSISNITIVAHVAITSASSSPILLSG